MSLNKSEALNAAKQHVLQRNVPAAIDTYRKIIVADPTELTAIDALGDLYASIGRVQEAIDEFSRLAESYSDSGFTRKAITTLKKIIALDPGNTETAIKLAGLYAQAGLPSEARQHYLQIVEVLARKGERLEALTIYGKIVDLDPSNTSTRIKLAELCLREGMNEQAYDAFVSAAEQLSRRGENRRALNAYNEALAIRPDSVEALAAARRLMLLLGLEPDKKLGSSVFDGEASRKLAKGSPSSLAGSDRTGESALLDKPQQSTASSFVVQEISKAEILVAYGQVNQAVAMLREVLKHNSDNLDVHIKLKDIFLRTGMMAEAATECRELERIHEARGEVERSRDYAVRASRLTQLIEQPSGDLKITERKQPEASKLGPNVAPLKDERPQDAPAKLRPASSTLNVPHQPTPTKFSGVPSAAPPISLPPASKQSTPRPDSITSSPPIADSPFGDKAPHHSAVGIVSDPPTGAGPTQTPDLPASRTDAIAPLTPATEQRRGEQALHESDTALVSSPPVEWRAQALPTLFADKLPVRKKRPRLTATATAAGAVAILALSSVVGGFAYNAHLDRQYQALASATPPLSTPMPPPAPVSEESAPGEAVEPITVVVNSPVQSDASDQKRSRELSEINNGVPSASQVPSPPLKEKTRSVSPAPPRVAVNTENRVNTENQIPLGVPGDVPFGPTHPAEPPPKTVRRSAGVVLGNAVKRLDPVYPVAAKEARQSGVVVVEVTINEQGNVTSTRAISGPALLRNAAVAAARAWKFKPSTLGGVPVTTTTTIAFNFKL